MVNCLVVVVLPGTKYSNIGGLEDMGEMREEFDWNNMVLMTFDNKVRLTVGNMAIEEKHTPVLIRSSINMVDEMVQPNKSNTVPNGD